MYMFSWKLLLIIIVIVVCFLNSFHFFLCLNNDQCAVVAQSKNRRSFISYDGTYSFNNHRAESYISTKIYRVSYIPRCQPDLLICSKLVCMYHISWPKWMKVTLFFFFWFFMIQRQIYCSHHWTLDSSCCSYIFFFSFKTFSY